MNTQAGIALRHARAVTDGGLVRLLCVRSVNRLQATQTRFISTVSRDDRQAMQPAHAQSKRSMYDYAVRHQPQIIPPPPATFTKTLPLYDFFADKTTKPKPSYSLAYGASGFAKKRKNNPQAPPQEMYTSTQIGEDAYFCRTDALGVADGVGGWTGTHGANPALYSRKLMHHAYLELERFDNIDDPCFYDYDDTNPIDIIQRSYEQSMMESVHENILGSSTMCLAILRGDELRVANIGDCGISVIRHGHYIFRSEEQQHAFNFPYQLGTNSPDRPKDAQMFQIKVEKGDIIVMGSDGLYDNLYDKEILSLVTSHIHAYTLPGNGDRPPRLLQFEPQRLSDALAQRAQAVSEDRRHPDSPFQRRAINEGFFYQGGKADDISVLVAVVRDNEDSPDRRL